MTDNGKTPLLQAKENSFENQGEEEDNSGAMYKHASNSTISRSFSAESGQFGDGAVISYHDICYSIETKEKGVRREKQIIKNLRWELSVSMILLWTQVAQAHHERSVYINLFHFAYIMSLAKYKSLYEKCSKYALIAINAK